MRKLLPVLLVLSPSLAFAWGFAGHRRLASLFHTGMPANHCLRQWIDVRQNSTLQDHACDPDRWRDTSNANYSPDEAPRHYLEVDRINPTSAYPRDWAVTMQTFPQYHTNNGRVPWRVEELYPQLVAAFVAKDTARVLDITFVMSHYVTDSFSVLHDTKDFNPGGTLHNRWESDMLQVSARITEITNLATGSYVGTAGRADPKNNIFDVVLVGQPIAAQLSTAHFANPTDDVAFFNAVKDLTARRWGDAITLLASIVWTAWAEAGAPVMNGFQTSGCSMAVPAQEIVFKGFPPVGGFTHPDGGNPSAQDGGFVIPDAGPPVDAGCLDGCGDDDAGTGGSGGGSGGGAATGGGGEGPMDPQPCGCAAAPGAFVLLALVALTRRKR